MDHTLSNGSEPETLGPTVQPGGPNRQGGATLSAVTLPPPTADCPKDSSNRLSLSDLLSMVRKPVTEPEASSVQFEKVGIQAHAEEPKAPERTPAADLEPQTVMPKGLAVEPKNMTLAFEHPEAPAILAALPHYQDLGGASARTVSHMELRLAIASIQESVGTEARLKVADIDPIITSLERTGLDGREGFIRRVDVDPSDSFHEDIEDVLRTMDPDGNLVNVSPAHADLLKKVPRIAYELTDRGIAAGVEVRKRTWGVDDNLNELPTTASNRVEMVAPGFDHRHAIAATRAGSELMLNRQLVGGLKPGELGSFFLGEMKSIESKELKTPTQAVVSLGRMEEVLFAMEAAAIQELEMPSLRPADAPLRAKDIETVLNLSKDLVARLEPFDQAKLGTHDMEGFMLDETLLQIGKLEGARKSLTAIQSAQSSGQDLNEKGAWQILSVTPQGYGKILKENDANVTAADGVWMWAHSQAADAKAAERIWDAFARTAFHSDDAFCEVLKTRLRTTSAYDLQELSRSIV